jgi:hypothetical protein
MISREAEAREVAERFLDVAVRGSLAKEVVTTSVREFSTCWVVGFNTRAFVETGSISHALTGGGPVTLARAREGESAARRGDVRGEAGVPDCASRDAARWELVGGAMEDLGARTPQQEATVFRLGRCCPNT